MKKRLVAMFAVAAMVLSIALPAAANGGTVGTFTGQAKVGKVSEGCQNDGTDTVSGGGLGLPSLVDKEAYYTLTTTVSDTVGTGTLNVCGHIHPNNTTGVGAACGSSSADHGKGAITYSNGSVVYLANVGWDDAVGGVLPIKGDVLVSNKGASKAKLTGVVVATGGAACATKSGAKDNAGNAGATQFSVVGTYVTQ